MPDNFDRSLPIIFREEGGLGNLLGDSGGLTNLGITHSIYDNFRQKYGLPLQSVAKITVAEATQIYLEEYWIKGGCDHLNWPLCLAHFNACVNMGPATAIKLLQRALDIDDDGIFGTQTKAAIDTINKDHVTTAAITFSVMLQHVFYYDSLDENDPRKTTFLTNLWLKRLKHIYNDINKVPDVYR